MHDAYLDTISGRKRGVTATCVRGALSLCEPAYAGGVRYRNWRFDQPHGAQPVSVPVISVGNLTTGGTGKTPVVAWIANRLAQGGLRPGILSRGYKSLDGSTNDEKLLLDRLCPGIPHIQNPDRVAGSRAAIDQQGCNILVLDDGFQHRRLRRDVDLVLIDALNPWGYGHLLPRGLLREPKSSLARASLVLITRADLCEPQLLTSLRTEIAEYTSAPLATAAFAAESLVDTGGSTAPLSSVLGGPALAFCGIGNPEGFRRTLSAASPEWTDLKLLPFPDHHHYTAADLTLIADRARAVRAQTLLTTEKDIVKLPATIGELPVWGIRIGLEIMDGADTLANALDSEIRNIVAT
ncbi:MAG: tetraacyldisaccharide 4'-kinase [Planctomycetaceae bacterium]